MIVLAIGDPPSRREHGRSRPHNQNYIELPVARFDLDQESPRMSALYEGARFCLVLSAQVWRLNVAASVACTTHPP